MFACTYSESWSISAAPLAYQAQTDYLQFKMSYGGPGMLCTMGRFTS